MYDSSVSQIHPACEVLVIVRVPLSRAPHLAWVIDIARPSSQTSLENSSSDGASRYALMTGPNRSGELSASPETDKVVALI
jgi:hypothetical protein